MSSAEHSDEVTLTVRCYREHNSGAIAIDGSLRAPLGFPLTALMGERIDLSTLDRRLQGQILLSRVSTTSPVSIMLGSGPISVEGRVLSEGDSVAITTGGAISRLWE